MIGIGGAGAGRRTACVRQNHRRTEHGWTTVGVTYGGGGVTGRAQGGTCEEVVARAVAGEIAARHPRPGGRRRATVRPRGPWSPQIKSSDVCWPLAWAVATVPWPPAYGAVPVRRAPAGAQLEEQLTGLVRARWHCIEALCAIGVEVSRTALAVLAGTGHRVTPGAASERLAGRVAGAYLKLNEAVGEEAPQVPGEEALPELVRSLVLALAPRPAPLSAEEFLAVAVDEYDAIWAARGRASNAAFRPQLIELGPAERPPLLADRDGESDVGGWMRGTGRSVYSRYRLHYKATARSRAASVDDERRPDPADAHERVLEEVARSCAPYGLEAAPHHMVLLALPLAATFEERGGPGQGEAVVRRAAEARAAWQQWKDPARLDDPVPPWTAPDDRSADPDAELVQALRGRLELWRAAGHVRILEHLNGSFSGQGALAERAIVRRTWMELHRREREFVRPARRRDLVKALDMALRYTVGEAFTAPERLGDAVSEAGSPAENAGGPGQDAPTAGETPEEFDDRLQRTGELVMADPGPEGVRSWRDQALAGDRGWTAEYDSRVMAAGDPGEYLTAAELADLMINEWRE